MVTINCLFIRFVCQGNQSVRARTGPVRASVSPCAVSALSHDPPIPTFDNPDPAMRERIIVRLTATPEQSAQRQACVLQAGREMGAGRSERRALNAQWDERVMTLLENGDWAGIEGISEDEIVREGGGSAHETRNWIAAFAAASGRALTVRLRWYRAIPELIAGFGVMLRVG